MIPASAAARPALAKSDIEKALAARFGRRFCCLTNRGTTALAAALAALGLPPRARVVFPAAMCSIPVFAARFAGLVPDFADVSLEDGNFDRADLERALAEGNAGAVVPVHMFGQPDDMEALAALCGRHGAALVEDVALSLGARLDGKPVGGFGRVSCLSFVRKMIPLEMGGAVLTDDPSLDRRARDFIGRLPAPPESQGERTKAAMKAFHSLTGYAAASDWAPLPLLEPFEAEFHRLLLSRTEEADWADSIVLEELASLDAVVGARRARAEVYETAISHPRIVPLRHDRSCFFAYPVRLAGVSAEEFLQFAAGRGCAFKRIAYPDVHPLFRPRRRFPGAETLEKELIGLPVDDDQPVSAFWDYAQDFLRLFEEFLPGESGRPPFDWRGKLELRMG